MTDAELDRLARVVTEYDSGNAAAAQAIIAEARRARAAEAALRGTPMADDVAREIEARLASLKDKPPPWVYEVWGTCGRVMTAALRRNGGTIADPCHAPEFIANAPTDLAALLADRRHLLFLVADKLEEDAKAAEERRITVAWLRGKADASDWDQSDALKDAADAIEAGRHVRPQGEGGA